MPGASYGSQDYGLGHQVPPQQHPSPAAMTSRNHDRGADRVLHHAHR